MWTPLDFKPYTIIKLFHRLYHILRTVMFSKEVTVTFSNGIKYFCATGELPYFWDDTTNRVQIRTGWIDIFPCILGVCMKIGLLGPALILGPKVCIDNSDEISEIVMGILELISMYTSLAWYTGFYVYRYEISTFMNQFMELMRTEGKPRNIFF